MTDPQHDDLTRLAHRVSTLVASLRRIATFGDRERTASLDRDLDVAERAVAALIDDMHERMVNRWAETEPRPTTPVPEGLRVTRYDANGQLVERRRATRFPARPLATFPSVQEVAPSRRQRFGVAR